MPVVTVNLTEDELYMVEELIRHRNRKNRSQVVREAIGKLYEAAALFLPANRRGYVRRQETRRIKTRKASKLLGE